MITGEKLRRAASFTILKPLVECAAIINSDVVFRMPRPARHHHLIRAMAQIGVPTPINATSAGGFVLTDGRFVTRRQAKRYAYAAGQITRERFESGRVFFSEDLW
jgi:hypothetical protein